MATAEFHHSSEIFPGSDTTPDELEFLRAMERYQRMRARRYPTFREVLAVLRSLGYRKVAEPVPVRSGSSTR